MLREEGLLDLERWQSDEMRDVPIPTSVQGLISSRLDRLEAKEKQLAHHASVIGSIFWAGAVAQSRRRRRTQRRKTRSPDSRSSSGVTSSPT